MSYSRKRRRREATIKAPSLEEIGLPPASRLRLDDSAGGSAMAALSCDEVVERLREHGVTEDDLQKFCGQSSLVLP